jgi:signal transduction histidine kinase
MALRADGTEFPVELTVTRIPSTGPPMFTGHHRDITERVQAYHLLEQRVEERTLELRTLLQTSRSVGSTLELRPLLGVILDGLKDVADYAASSLWTLQGEDMVLIASRSPEGDAPNVPVRFATANVAPGMWQALCAGEPIIVDNVYSDTEAARAYRATFGASPGSPVSAGSWMAVPLMVKEQVTGMLTLFHERPQFYSLRHARLALALGHQAAVAIENAELYARAQEVAVLEERQRLARELHDSVSQALYSIVLGTRAAQDQVDRDRARLVDALDYVLSLAGAALSEMRTLIFELRPETLEQEGLVSALQKQIRSLEVRHGLEVTATLGDEPDLPLKTKEMLYRIAQEAMHNIVKHAQARTVSVLFAQREHTLVLEVQDDGKGFDPRASLVGHLGLPSMQERAARLGGRLAVTSEPGKGAQVVVEVPIPGRPRQP